jgi:AcrR family transcriptional regulator
LRRGGIVGAALECFAENGFEATTIADICERARASTGSVYHHFGDKQGVASEAYRQVLALYHQSLLAALPKLSTARECVEGMVVHFFGWVRSHPAETRFLVEMRDAQCVRRFDDGIREDTRQFLDAASDVIERHARAGELRVLPRHLYSALILGPAMSVVAAQVRGGSLEKVGKDARVLAAAAWRSLAPER